MSSTQEQKLLDLACKALERQGIPATAAPATGRGNARLELLVQGHKLGFTAEVKKNLRPALVGLIEHELAGRQNPLLISDYVSPPLAETFRQRKIQFADAAGNAYINRSPAYIWVKGNPRHTGSAEEGVAGAGIIANGGRAFQPTGLAVIFALLCNPDLTAEPYRTIAQFADVAHGTVGWVMPELVEQGYVAEVEGKRRLLRGRQLMKSWAEAYLRTLRPRLTLKRFRAESFGGLERADLAEHGVILGGEPAAQIYTKHLRPATVTLFSRSPIGNLYTRWRLTPDPQGNVEWLRQFWNFAGELPGLAPRILTYADLLGIGDARCLETADILHEQIISRFK